MPLSHTESFQLFTTATGEKKSKSSDLLAIIFPENTRTAGIFTQNTFVGAPVTVSKEILQKTRPKAILINSGVANVATGKQGIEDAKRCAEFLSQSLKTHNSLDIKPEEILLSSTGRIGDFLPMEAFKKHVSTLTKWENECKIENLEHAAKAIMTTDLVPKYITKKIGNITISGIAKGSGMIEPNMATMLAFVMTDAKIEQKILDTLWKKIGEKSFNMISVDACESTSDMALLFASGQNEIEDFKAFEKTLEEICIFLAKSIAKDGEGATCLIECTVSGNNPQAELNTLAKSVIKSDLLKCAIHGKDLNWGRIMGALGSTHIPFTPENISCSINTLEILKNGRPCSVTPEQEKEVFENMKNNTVYINISLLKKTGSEESEENINSATAWGCDLSHKYIDINADYRT